MKNLWTKLLLLILTLALIVGCLVACDNGKQPGGDDNGDGKGDNNSIGELVDYASEVKLDKNSGRAWCEVTVKTFVDGDTTHFNVPKSVTDTRVLKARYLGINTPESTGKIEPWGKKASNYTKEKLSAATSIIIESNDDKWNHDSTAERYLVWVWYKTAEMQDYRCLNLELLQAGLARSSKISDTVYADVANTILSQAVSHKLYVFGTEKDTDFYYGAAQAITLKELKTHIADYKDTRVSFEGVVARQSAQTVYVEEFDEETGLYFGIQVYYGYNLDYDGKEILSVGNRVRIVGSVQYYETGGTYQISDISYNVMRPDDETNIQLISKGHSASYEKLDAETLLRGTVDIEITKVGEDGEETLETKSFKIGFLKLHGTASMDNLTITDLYTTSNEDSSNKGAISITCVDAHGTEIVVRTAVLKDASGNTITQDVFRIGEKINVRGIVDVYNGVYQIKVFSIADITEVIE